MRSERCGGWRGGGLTDTRPGKNVQLPLADLGAAVGVQPAGRQERFPGVGFR
jgi:hypothetical protein